MTAPQKSTTILRDASETATDTVSLSYDARLLRRKRLIADSGIVFHIDLPETVSLNEGDCFLFDDNTRIAVKAAPEPLLEVKGDLPRLAWHIGNRHTPCQVGPDRLLIQADHVLADMLSHLGAEVTEVTESFTPEGGAYGHGRTFAHDHGHSHGLDHSHDQDHHHHHDHSHG